MLGDLPQRALFVVSAGVISASGIHKDGPEMGCSKDLLRLRRSLGAESLITYLPAYVCVCAKVG